MIDYWDIENRTLVDIVLMAVAGWCAFLALNGYLLAKNGQTIGKLVTNTKIVDAGTGELVPFWRLLVLRYVLPGLAPLAPIVGPLLPLVDVAFIFRRDRRCIHDLIAGTRVVLLNAE